MTILLLMAAAALAESGKSAPEHFVVCSCKQDYGKPPLLNKNFVVQEGNRVKIRPRKKGVFGKMGPHGTIAYERSFATLEEATKVRNKINSGEADRNDVQCKGVPLESKSRNGAIKIFAREKRYAKGPEPEAFIKEAFGAAHYVTFTVEDPDAMSTDFGTPINCEVMSFKDQEFIPTDGKLINEAGIGKNPFLHTNP